MAFYITTPIYYVNAAPHLGHAYTTIGADILARHMRQRGEDVFFLTGTDEHGEPVAQAAEREGVSPRELADRNAQRFRDLMPRIDVSNDYFIRTSDPRHKKRVQEIMQRVHDNGHVYKGIYEGWYCPRCADFKTENELGPGNTCPIHKIPLDKEREENWFFRLSSFQEPLERLYAEQADFVMPRQRFNEALSFITSGLNDVSLSRAKIRWGVEVPWDPEHVFYVWFDALLNYVTALGFAHDGKDETAEFWPATYHVMAKDILKFHAVIWPALLLAAGLELPRHLFIHGYLLMKDASGEEHKMSKSLGNVLDPFAVMDTFGTDALRYYCFREVSFGQDGSVSTATFGDRYESELANEFGNLASRTLAMIAPLPRRGGARRRRRPRARGRLRGPRRRGVRAARPRGDHPGARAHLAARAPAEPLRRGAGPVAARQGARAAPRSSTSRCARWPRACASSPCCCGPTSRRPPGGCWRRWAGWRTTAARRRGRPAAGARDRGRALRRRARRLRGAARAAAVPQAAVGGPVIDSHTHLDRGPAPEDELVAAARAAGVRRILTIGMDSASCRAALDAADRHEEVYAAVGRHPNVAEGYDDAVTAELRELAAHPKCKAIGETGLDYYRDTAPRADQERAFAAQIALAHDTGKPLVIHTRAAEDDTVDTLAREADGLEVIMHCFSMPARLDECLERGWWISFAGNVTYPKAGDLAEAAERVPLDRLLVETDAPYLTPQVVRKERNQPANVVHTARFVAERRGIEYERLEAAVDANAARLFGW